MDGGARFRTPTLLPWMRNLLIALVATYVIELVLRNAGMPVYALAWQPLGHGFGPWQPLTRFLVQGPNVMGVLFGALLVYFLLPALWEVVEAEKLRNALIWGAVGGTLLPFLADLVLADGGSVMGWTTLAWVLLPTLFGLAMPEQSIYLMFVIPVNGRFILWATAVISGLVCLIGAPSSIGAAEAFGTWLGTYGWWQLRGPGARRRELKQKAASIERELHKFRVIEGGKAQGDQDGDPDEWVH